MSSPQFGVPIDGALQRRERLANRYDYQVGQDRVFPQLVVALLDELPEGGDVLEVGAATGLLTKPLLTRVGALTALEPSPGMLRRILQSSVSEDPRLSTQLGMVEDLAEDAMFDRAVVTFTPRRGVGLLTLLAGLSAHVRDRVVFLLEDDVSMDWAFLARAAVGQGFDVRARFVSNGAAEESGRLRAVILTMIVTEWSTDSTLDDVWDLGSKALDVPQPMPRGTATRLVRYFLSGGDRAMVVHSDRDSLERLYGNLRTAAHRLARDEITVRRVDDGIQLIRLPKSSE